MWFFNIPHKIHSPVTVLLHYGDIVGVPIGIGHSFMHTINYWSLLQRESQVAALDLKHLQSSGSAHYHSSEVAKLCKCYSNSSGGCVIKSTSTSFLGWMVDTNNSGNINMVC